MAPPLILIVDDNLDARGYAACIAHEGPLGGSGQQAGRAHADQARKPALILMDATMPRMDSWKRSGTEGGRRDEAHPLIMLTAHAFDEHRERAKKAGADGFLAKPVLPDALAREIRQFLKL
jgi:CheY-like chemotaxis protein